MEEDFETAIKREFLEEATEMLQSAETCFLALERAHDDPEVIERLFRLAHNLKGSAAAVGFADLAQFTHHLESLFLGIRARTLAISPEVISLLLACNDHLQAGIAGLQADPGAALDNSALLARIQGLMGAVEAEADVPDERGGAKGVEPVPQKVGAGGDESIRVGLAMIDRLLNNVGELVILEAALFQNRSDVPSLFLQRSIVKMHKIVREVQDLSMSMRMVPLKQTLQKMQRIVRDTSATLGKQAQLVIQGEDTAVDKTALEQLNDPLVHLVRNALDHGLEGPEARVLAGKPREGKVTIAAYHRGSNVVIEVRDDGSGLDAARIRAKALERGLIKAGDSLTSQQIYQLLFLPGFSTRSEVTDLSGRGVGLDVVQQNIQLLQGEIQLETVLGQGTTFRILLPLTLAIVDGIIVRLGEHRYIVPIVQITESLQPRAEDVRTVAGEGELLSLRGEVLPVFRLERLLGQPVRQPRAATDSIALIVRPIGGSPCAIIVDDVAAVQQVVVKALGEEVRGLPGISGAAVLGDGRAALILDLVDLVQARRRGVQPARIAVFSPALKEAS